MPEGHKIHRIARAFGRDFAGRTVRATSPQGRFADGAAALDGLTLVDARAVGKQLFLGFDNDRHLRVHLGLYGGWEFAGAISEQVEIEQRVAAGPGRLVRPEPADFPAPPVGQVRLRLQTGTALADLRGPTACVLMSGVEQEEFLTRLGPDPLAPRTQDDEAEFVRRLRRRAVPVGQLLMDQAVVAGIGNIYRAEMLFRASLNPFTSGKAVDAGTAAALWQDWAHLLTIGVDTGLMLTMEGIDEQAQKLALAGRADRHWVYRRAGLPCRVCGTEIALQEMVGRKLYWCPRCQA